MQLSFFFLSLASLAKYSGRGCSLIKKNHHKKKKKKIQKQFKYQTMLNFKYKYKNYNIHIIRIICNATKCNATKKYKKYKILKSIPIIFA